LRRKHNDNNTINISKRGLPLESTLGLIPVTHYSSAEEEINYYSSYSNNNNNDNNNNIIICNDNELADKWLVERNNYLAKRIRDNPNGITNWLSLVSLQNRGVININTNNSNKSNTQFLIYEKQISILKDCISHFNSYSNNHNNSTNANVNNSTVVSTFLLILMLTRKYEPMKYKSICEEAMRVCPFQLQLWLLR